MNGSAFLSKSDICDPLKINTFPVTDSDLFNGLSGMNTIGRRLFFCTTENIVAPAMLVIGRHSLTQQQL